MNPIQRLDHGFIVSCQAKTGSTLDDPRILAALAGAAEEGGAAGVRANLPRNIKAVKSTVSIPVIGIFKQKYSESDVYITPTFSEAQAVAEAGADVVALDGTSRPRPHGEGLADLIHRIHEELHLPVMADLATFAEAQEVGRMGAELLATTLCGYTSDTADWKVPNEELVRRISTHLPQPLIVEGRVHSPTQAREALEWGGYAVVVGTAITNVAWATAQFIDRMKGR